MKIDFSKHNDTELREYLKKAHRKCVDLRNSRRYLAGSGKREAMKNLSVQLRKYTILHEKIRQELLDRGVI